MTPKPTPVSSVSTPATASAWRSTDGVAGIGSVAGISRDSTGTAATATRTPQIAAGERDEEALGDQLPDQPLAPGPERRTELELAASR